MTKQHNFRLDETTDELLDRLAQKLGMSKVDVVRQSIREKAGRELTGKLVKNLRNDVDNV